MLPWAWRPTSPPWWGTSDPTCWGPTSAPWWCTTWSHLAYFFVAFTIYSWLATGGQGVGVFWKNIVTPALTALGTGSSTATLPVNLEAASRMGIPEDIREVVLPIGATAHMEGSCLSGILKIAFLFGIFHMPFAGLGTFASAILVAVLSGVVLSGIPGGGLVGEMLIVSLYGFPPEAFPIVATLGFLVDPAATMVNATGGHLFRPHGLPHGGGKGLVPAILQTPGRPGGLRSSSEPGAPCGAPFVFRERGGMTMEPHDLRERLRSFPRFPLLREPTPLHPLENLSRDLGVDLRVKRDDMTGLAAGGQQNPQAGVPPGQGPGGGGGHGAHRGLVPLEPRPPDRRRGGPGRGCGASCS